MLAVCSITGRFLIKCRCDPGTAPDLAQGAAADGWGDVLGRLKDAGCVSLIKPNLNPTAHG